MAEVSGVITNEESYVGYFIGTKIWVHSPVFSLKSIRIHMAVCKILISIHSNVLPLVCGCVCVCCPFDLTY